MKKSEEEFFLGLKRKAEEEYTFRGERRG